MRGARIYYPRVPRLMRDDHRRISSRCVRNRNSSCTTSLDHTRYKTLPARPVQNSPSKPQNADFGPLFACRENFVPLPPPTTRAGRTLSRMRCHFRYKTLPASGLGRPTRYKTLPARPARRPTRYKTLPASGLGRPTRYKTLPASPARRPTRYKTLPASPKTPISAHFSHAGRTFYRFRHQQPEQGELCTASATNNPSRENFIPHAVPLPVQNSPSEPGSAAHPVQNSPSKPQNADFGPLFACRENFVPLPPPTRRAGRTISRTNTPPHPNNVPLSKFRMQFD